jgi:hypothetical protein
MRAQDSTIAQSVQFRTRPKTMGPSVVSRTNKADLVRFGAGLPEYLFMSQQLTADTRYRPPSEA